MTIRTMRSNGSIFESSRRPITRTSTRMKKKTSGAKDDVHGSGVDRRVVLHAHERLAFVGELEVLRPPAERGRVDLVLEADDELVPGLHRTVDEDAPFIPMPPFHRLRLERVHGEPLEPARTEDERGLREPPVSGHANRHLVDEPAANRAGRLESDRGGVTRD